MVDGTVQGLDSSRTFCFTPPPSPSSPSPPFTATSDADADRISCEEVNGDREFVAMETVAVGMREERAAIRSEAEIGRQGWYSKLVSRGVEGGGDIRGVAVALAEEF